MPEQNQIGPGQYEAHDNSLTVYLNGFAHVATSVDLKMRNGVAQVFGIPAKVMLESLHPIAASRNVAIKEARVLNPTTLAEIAQSQQLGGEIYDASCEASAEFIGLDGDNVLVKGRRGLSGGGLFCYGRPLTDFAYFADEANVAKIRPKQSLELKLGGLEDGQETRLYLSYLTEGIELSPSYNVTLVGDKLKLTADVVVKNRTGKPYEDVELTFVPGEVEKPEAIRCFHEMGRRFGLPVEEVEAEVASLDEVSDGVTRSEKDGQIVYGLGKRGLPLGESKFELMNRIPELDYKLVYRANLGRSLRPEITAVLGFEAPLTLPVGSIEVYSERPEQGDDRKVTEHYEGGGQIGSPALKGTKVNIDLRTPDTLEMKVEQVGQAEMINTGRGTKEIPLWALQTEFKVTAKNAGQDNVTIETYLTLSPTQKLTESVGLAHYAEGQARWDVPVKAGEEVTFNYRIQDERFTPMRGAELKRLLKTGGEHSEDIY